MSRTAASLLLVLGFQMALSPRVAEAHVPPPAYLNLTIADTQTEVVVTVSFAVFQDWCGLDPATLPSDGVLALTQRQPLEAALGQWLRVRVDGRTREGTLVDAKSEQFEDHLQMWSYVHLRMRYPTDLPPRQVAFAWTNYTSATGWVFDELDAELEAYGVTDYPVFRKREPETIWHRPQEVDAPAPIVLPQPIEPARVPLPLISTALLLAFLVFAVRHRRTPRVWFGLPIALVAALALHGVARVEVPVPWQTRLDRPGDDAALAIFASLHRGVYEAVDGDTEDEIYDALSQSVTDELLPALYMDIHRSLILKKEGGAVAKIQKTEIIEAEILPAGEAGAAWFKVRARWRVEGKVGHWGHTHQRLNEYQADITIIAVNRRWKIAAIDVLDESRVDDGKPVR